jgi:hypothetical protein
MIKDELAAKLAMFDLEFERFFVLAGKILALKPKGWIRTIGEVIAEADEREQLRCPAGGNHEWSADTHSNVFCKKCLRNVE